jgi:hypothetical protein
MGRRALCGARLSVFELSLRQALVRRVKREWRWQSANAGGERAVRVEQWCWHYEVPILIFGVGRCAITPSVRMRASGEARHVATAS